jgi:hypothetical protein
MNWVDKEFNYASCERRVRTAEDQLGAHRVPKVGALNHADAESE